MEAAALYDLLEQRVAPRFYERGETGLPDRWIEMVRQTLTHLGPKVLAGRMVREYVERLYAPAAHAHRAHDPGHGTGARRLEVPGARRLAQGDRRPCGDLGGDRPRADRGARRDARRCAYGWAWAISAPDDVEVQAVSGRVDARTASPTRRRSR